VKLSKTVKVSLTGVIDTGEDLLTGVNDTGNACFAGVVDAGEALKQSNTSANNRKKLKPLLGMSTGPRRNSLKKKTRGKKSRDTVPLIIYGCQWWECYYQEVKTLLYAGY
jgi:hypothetical protein